jgi:hypothetical protein
MPENHLFIARTLRLPVTRSLLHRADRRFFRNKSVIAEMLGILHLPSRALNHFHGHLLE